MGDIYGDIRGKEICTCTKREQIPRGDLRGERKTYAKQDLHGEKHIPRGELHGKEIYMKRVHTRRGTYMKSKHIQRENVHGREKYK